MPPGMAVRVHYNNADVTALCRGFHPAPAEYLHSSARGRRADASEARDATGEPLFLFHERQGLRRLLLFPRPREFTGAVLPGFTSGRAG